VHRPGPMGVEVDDHVISTTGYYAVIKGVLRATL
jgi:hypothetical protein